MNYHLLTDHFFTDNFIDISEKVSPNNSTYLFTFKLPAKYVKSAKGVIAPYGSEALKSIVNNITINDRVYVHWFHNDVMRVIDSLDSKVPLYLFFWGGDFLAYSKYFTDFNFDPLTQKLYNKNIVEVDKIEKRKLLYKTYSPRKIILMIKNVLLFNKRKADENKADYNIRKRFLDRLNYFCHWNKLDYDIFHFAYECPLRFQAEQFAFEYPILK